MKQGQFSNEQIVAVLQQAEKGEKPITELCKEKGISEAQVKDEVLLRLQATKEFVGIEEVASAALYLAGDAARNITGTQPHVDWLRDRLSP